MSLATLEFALSRYSIEGYLEQRGEVPTRRRQNDRLEYICPIPDHADSRPSFVVRTDPKPDLFFCHGCKRGGTIVRLIHLMEGADLHSVIGRLCDGILVTTEEILEFEKRMYDKAAGRRMGPPPVAESLFSMASATRCFLEMVNFEQSEVHAVDEFWKRVDGRIADGNMDDLQSMAERVWDRLEARKEAYHKRNMEAEVAAYARSQAH